MKPTTLLSALASIANGAVIWDGRLNGLSSAKDLEKWSWSNQVGPYQYYIHGSGGVDKYVTLSPDNKNPNDTVSKQGVKITLDSTSFWNGQNMRRTELIPQADQKIASGKLFYHFSIMRKATNAPSVNREHQICFFESHFTELKYGWISGEQGTSNPNLQWMTSQKSHWKTEWEPEVWHNVAYEIVCFVKCYCLLPRPPFQTLSFSRSPFCVYTQTRKWPTYYHSLFLTLSPLRRTLAPTPSASGIPQAATPSSRRSHPSRPQPRPTAKTGTSASSSYPAAATPTRTRTTSSRASTSSRAPSRPRSADPVSFSTSPPNPSSPLLRVV